MIRTRAAASASGSRQRIAARLLEVSAFVVVLFVDLVVIDCAGGRAARAAEVEKPAASAAQKAKQHYLRGEAYFKAHAFSAAMGEYLSGYEEKPDPVFIFNVAQCQRLLGHPGPALQSYRRYLKDAPEGAGRAVAEKQIAELERLLPGETAGGGWPGEGAPFASALLETDPPVTPLPADSPATVTTSAPQPQEPPDAPAPMPAGDARGATGGAPASASAPPPSGVSTTAAVVVAPVAALATSPPGPAPSALLVTRSEPAPRPIYKRWWFWTGVGAASLIAVIAIAASSNARPGCDTGRLCR